MTEKIDLSEELNKKIEIIKDDVLSGKTTLLELELNPLFHDLKDSLSIFNIENYSLTYKNVCELLNEKFEELKNLLSSLNIDEKFFEFMKAHPEDEEIFEIFKGCWRKVFYIDGMSLNFLEYASDRFCKERLMELGIKHLKKGKIDDQFLLEIPKYKFTEKMTSFFNKIKEKLPCYFEDVFDDELDQMKVYEYFVYLLHLLQLNKIKYEKNTNTLYI